MSWFDKLFGEDNDSNDDLIHRKKKRRQESQNIDNDHDSCCLKIMIFIVVRGKIPFSYERSL